MGFYCQDIAHCARTGAEICNRCRRADLARIQQQLQIAHAVHMFPHEKDGKCEFFL